MLEETAAIAMRPDFLRLQESVRMLELYNRAQGERYDSYFDMICFSDAFLFLLVSVEELTTEEARAALKLLPIFQFLKQMRNVTAHHSVLTGSNAANKYARPVSRHVFADGGGGRMSFYLPRIEVLLNLRASERPREKPSIDVALTFAQAEFAAQVFIEDFFARAVEAVRSVLPADSEPVGGLAAA